MLNTSRKILYGCVSGTFYKFSKPLAIDQSHVIILISVPGLSHHHPSHHTGYDITDPFHPKYPSIIGCFTFWELKFRQQEQEPKVPTDAIRKDAYLLIFNKEVFTFRIQNLYDPKCLCSSSYDMTGHDRCMEGGVTLQLICREKL